MAITDRMERFVATIASLDRRHPAYEPIMRSISPNGDGHRGPARPEDDWSLGSAAIARWFAKAAQVAGLPPDRASVEYDTYSLGFRGRVKNHPVNKAAWAFKQTGRDERRPFQFVHPDGTYSPSRANMPPNYGSHLPYSLSLTVQTIGSMASRLGLPTWDAEGHVRHIA